MPHPCDLPGDTPGSEGGRLSSPPPLGTWDMYRDKLQGLMRQGGCCRVRGCLVAASAPLRSGVLGRNIHQQPRHGATSLRATILLPP